MLPIIARWTVLEGKREAALAALRELAKDVEEKEPFVPMYTIHTPNFSQTNFPTPPVNEVIFLSVFDDREAFEKHFKGLFQDWLVKYKDLFLTNSGNLFVIAEWLRREAGFIRQSMVTGFGGHKQ